MKSGNYTENLLTFVKECTANLHAGIRIAACLTQNIVHINLTIAIAKIGRFDFRPAVRSTVDMQAEAAFSAPNSIVVIHLNAFSA